MGKVKDVYLHVSSNIQTCTHMHIKYISIYLYMPYSVNDIYLIPEHW